MSIEELEKLNIFSINSKIHPRNFIISRLGEFKIPDYYNLDCIYEMIHEEGIIEGIKRGKDMKIEEIKKCLDINIE